MSVIDLKISNTNDDACTYDTAFWLSEHNFYFGNSGPESWDNGVRFLGVTIPKGSIVNAAYVTYTCVSARSDDTVRLDIYGEQNNAAATFSTLADFDGRAKTTAKVDWDFTTDWVLNGEYNTPDISAIIQELVDDYSGLSSASIVIFCLDDGSTNGAHRMSNSYYAPTKAAKLHIEYTKTGPLPMFFRP